MKKRGSHVGITLSFVIFIVFVGFLYIIFEPSMNIKQDKELALEYLEKELIESSTAELTTVSILFNMSSLNDTIFNSETDLCLEIKSPENFGELFTYAIVKNEEENLIASKKEENNLNFNFTNQSFLKIYYSSELVEEALLTETADCVFINKTNYSIGHIQKKEYIFKSKILALIGDYYTISPNIKNLINSEFDFGFTDSEGPPPTWTNEIKNVSTSVYAKEIPIQYIDEEANIKSGYLNIRIW